MASSTSFRVLPGFGLSLGYTLGYLSLIVLIPLAAVFFKAGSLGFDHFWAAATSPRVLASYRLSFGASLIAAGINAVFGLMLAWVLVRSGRRRRTGDRKPAPAAMWRQPRNGQSRGSRP